MNATYHHGAFCCLPFYTRALSIKLPTTPSGESRTHTSCCNIVNSCWQTKVTAGIEPAIFSV